MSNKNMFVSYYLRKHLRNEDIYDLYNSPIASTSRYAEHLRHIAKQDMVADVREISWIHLEDRQGGWKMIL
jgi:hypothetical protein